MIKYIPFLTYYAAEEGEGNKFFVTAIYFQNELEI